MRRFSVTGVISFALPAFVVTALSGASQTPLAAYHDLSVMARWPLGKMQVRGAMGQSGSFALVELPAGGRTTAHHHTQEQIVLGVRGSMDVSLGGATHRLGSSGAALVPSDVEHFSINGGSETATFIEFQPMVRRDWFPPHPKIASSAGPTAVPVPSDARVVDDFALSSQGWRVERNGTRSKVLGGKTMQLTFWDLSADTASADLRPQRGERFLYVVEGHLHVAIGLNAREIGREMLVVVSESAEDIRLTSVKRGRTVVAVFETAGR
jgi:quercetin dioxygenase-like cupin family protein